MSEFNEKELLAAWEFEVNKALSGKSTENTPFPVHLKPRVISFYKEILNSKASGMVRERLSEEKERETSQQHEDVIDLLRERFTLPEKNVQHAVNVGLSKRDVGILDQVYDCFVENFAIKGPGQDFMRDNRRDLHASFSKAVRGSRYSLMNKMKTRVSQMLNRGK